MANTVYENEVIRASLVESLNTKLGVRSLMKIDTDLTANAGTKKIINTYTYTGAAQDVAAGADNTVIGELTFTGTPYEAVWTQGQFQYTDEDLAMDPTILDLGVQGVAKEMTNDLNNKFFAELQKASLIQPRTSGADFTYEDVVDAIAKMETEDESNIYLVIGNDIKQEIRKDADFMAADSGSILFNGQIGTICGFPVVVSKKVPATAAYLVDKNAITMFVKKDAEVEQIRTPGTRTNGVIMRRVSVVALTDATRLVAILEYIAKPVITTVSIAAGSNKAFAGTCVSGAAIKVTVDGVATADATVVGTNWSYTIPTAVEGKVYNVIASKANYVQQAAATGLTVTA